MVTLLAAAVLAPIPSLGQVSGPGWAWVEGESASANIQVQREGWGRPELLSEGRWLHVSIPENEVEAKVPEEGVVLRYSIQAPASGRYTLWNRVGYEFVRSDFDWRFDNGPWQKARAEDLTTDLQELQTWTEVAWLNLGQVEIAGGARTLEIRVPKEKAADGKFKRVLYASDAILLTDPTFHPNGKHRPGQDHQTDRDRAAARNVFQVPDAKPGERSSVTLSGDWEVARDDEQAPPFDVAVPMELATKPLFWSAIQVPSDRNVARPDLVFAHRLWYRTKFRSSGQAAHFLEFERNNLNTTVYVNGQLCGFQKNPLVSFRVDISKAVKPGENELWVGIRDPWYGYSTNPNDPLKLRKKFNIPLSVAVTGFQDLAYPIWNCFQAGILDPVHLVQTGPAYVDDVFVKPSVARKEIALDLTLSNPGAQDRELEVELEAVDAKTGQVAKSFGSEPFTVKAGESVVKSIVQPWADPQLWWPDAPHLYKLRARVKAGASVLDTSETSFGFREWTTRGPHYYLNGILWRGWAELTQGNTPQAFLQNYRNSGQRFMRLSGFSQNAGIRWKGLTFREALRFFDENGVVVRRSGELDGQVIGYMAIENDPDLKKLYGSDIKMQLMRNWQDQMAAQVRAERNHPSIHLWSLENEWLYINCINLYAGLMDEFEREVKVAGDRVLKEDPTRLYMVDGGGAGREQLFPVHGDHYVYTNRPEDYPGLAYQDFPTGGGRGRWTWDGKRPRYLGEDFYATGINPADYAWIGGETAFEGKVGAHPGIARVQRMLQEGYRWHGRYSFWHFWVGDEGANLGKYKPNAERAVLIGEKRWSFGSEEKASLEFRVVNDSRHNDPLTLGTTIEVGGRKVADSRLNLSVPPGEAGQVIINVAMPKVSARTEGTVSLVLQADGQTVFEDRRSITVLPPATLSAAARQAQVAVYPGESAAVPVLRAMGARVFPVSSLDSLPTQARVLVIGSNAITEAQSSQTALAAWAVQGRRVIVLDQEHPLGGLALPAEVQKATNHGAFAFPEDLSHPVLRGFASGDFENWTGRTYRNAPLKPIRGAKSLVQCHTRLGHSALLEVPVGEGLMLLSQLNFVENLEANPLARKLLANLIDHAVSYKLEVAETRLVAESGGLLARAIGQIGARVSPTSSLAEAVSKPGVVVLEATPANLRGLVGQEAQVRRFLDAGGSLVLNGLTPDGLADYNRLVGVEHQIRPFIRERVTLRTPRDPLAAGLTLRDVSMLSSERLFAWTSDMYAANDVFSYIVDVDDVAPFAKLPNDYFKNTVNGFVSADGWPYIFSFELATGTKPEYEMSWDKPQNLNRMEWIGNGFYHFITKFELVADGQERRVFNVAPNTDPQELAIDPPLTARKLEFRALEWQRTPNVNDVIGIDNLKLFAVRPPEFSQRVRPLLNIGGIVRYPRGKGQIVLCNLRFKEAEEVPENAAKKRSILATVLRNLKVPFSDGKLVIAGAEGVRYQPIDLSKSANQFRSERGWFGDPNRTFKDFPIGRQTFAQVPFEVYEFPTSPVPNAVMLGGPGVPGNLPNSVTIPVDAKASALFFLQTARVDRRLNDDERRRGVQAVLGEYVVAFADGTEEVVPILVGEDAEDFRQRTPRSLTRAALAWSRAYAESDENAAAWTRQWNNPHADKVIRSVTLRYPAGDARFGVPVLLALTAAN